MLQLLRSCSYTYGHYGHTVPTDILGHLLEWLAREKEEAKGVVVKHDISRHMIERTEVHTSATIVPFQGRLLCIYQMGSLRDIVLLYCVEALLLIFLFCDLKISNNLWKRCSLIMNYND